jgi:hypothetical protein
LNPDEARPFIALGPREMRIAINSSPRGISDIRLRSRRSWLLTHGHGMTSELSCLPKSVVAKEKKEISNIQ